MKTSIYFITLLFAATIILLITCKKDDENIYKTPKIVKERVTGYVQKGPYINGSTIDIVELNNSLGQTGRVFKTTITNNKGSFEIENIELSSQYVEFKALGFYFNEVIGDISVAQFALSAISDLTDISIVNVNILTHLEESRVKYLIGKGVTFAKAKDSAQDEVLAIFGFTKADMQKSEMLDISINSEENAILLAISVILQGNRSVADLTEVLANMITDIKEDGILNNENTRSMFYNTTQDLDLVKIRENLEKRYEELEVAASIPAFEQQVNAYLVSQKPFNIESTITNSNCHGANNGKIDITMGEGTPPFSYAWSNGALTEDVKNLAPGSYSVTITDANKYILTKKNMTITEPSEITISGDVIKATCESSDGSLDITVSGGTPPYLYSWSNGNTSEDINNIAAGNYKISVTDANQCFISRQFTVEKNISEILVSGNVFHATSCESNNGSIDITISGGTPPYLYFWSNGSTIEDLNNLNGDNYIITVTDAIGCPKSHEFILTSPVCDIDGNEYKTVAIGNQVWMAENLKTTKYKNGTSIPLVNDNVEWGLLLTPGYCWYNNDEAAYSGNYGALYNWYTVNTTNLCPADWHVPSDPEWTTLSDYLGGEDVAGGKLKEAGFNHWNSPNTGATNETGFTALPGGYCDYNGNFALIGNYGLWWSSTENVITSAYHPILFNESSKLDRGDFHKRSGFSIRCVRD